MTQHSSCHKYRWDEIEIGELLDSVDKQLQKVGSLPTKLVQDWDVYHYLTQAVGTIQKSVPMVEGLKR